MSALHELKVVPPYFEALFTERKNFEVRRNDRGFQAGDVLHLREYGTHDAGLPCETRCTHQGRCESCHKAGHESHYSGRDLVRTVAFVYAGDPRFGGIEPGHVVLGFSLGLIADDDSATP